jgi:hypothetical protein
MDRLLGENGYHPTRAAALPAVAVTRRPCDFVAKAFYIGLVEGPETTLCWATSDNASYQIALQQNRKLVDLGMAGSGAVLMKGYFQSYYQPAIGIVA